MFRKIGFGAAAALTAGLLAVGCSEDGDTIILPSLLMTDDFPGSQVDENNLADDRRAFSESGQTVQSTEMYWNTETGEAILLFVTTTNVTGEFILYAAYFNGSSWAAPVPIRGRDGNTNEDPSSAPVGYKVLWINTQGSSDANARARHGDAIIIWTRRDQAVGGGVTSSDEDPNVRLWGTYFDKSEASAPPTGTIVRGFNTEGQVLDDDNQVTGSSLNDPGVQSFGFASSSLSKTHEFTANVDAVDSGEPTTEVHIIYEKAQSSGSTSVGTRYKVITFNLNQQGNAFPTGGGNVLNPAQGSFDASDNVTSDFVVHNNMVLWRVQGIGTSPDDIVTASVIDANGTVTAIGVGSTPVASSTDSTELPLAANVYGPDHGLTSYYIIGLESGFQGNGSNGGRPGDTGLFLRKLDVGANGTVTGDGAEPAQIDEFAGNQIALDTGEGDFLDERPAAGAAPVQPDVQTRMNRTGTAIFVLYRQNNTDVVDTAPSANGTNDVAQQNILVKGCVIQTRRDSTPRSLANSFSTTVIPAQEKASGDMATGQVQMDVVSGGNVFQQGLIDGQAVSQGGLGAELGCAFQSNPDRVNFAYRQRDNQTGAPTPASEDELLLVDGMVFTPDTTGSNPPTVTLTSGGATKAVVARADQVDAGGSGLDFPDHANAGMITDVTLVDLGDNSTTTSGTFTASAGRVMVFYGLNGNASDDLDASGAFVERRLFVAEQQTNNTSFTSKELSSNPSGTNVLDYHQYANGSLRVALVSVNRDVTNSPSHRPTTVHAFWLEDALRGGNPRLATRSFDATATTATPAVSFDDRFTPPLSVTTPVFIDSLDNGDIVGPIQVCRSGSTVGVFFVENEHGQYQQTSGTANGYYTDGVQPTPQLIDNESAEDVQNLWVMSPPECDNLSRTNVFFLKPEGPSGDLRMQVRVVH